MLDSGMGGGNTAEEQIGKFIVARVADINLNSNSDLFTQSGKWTGIGTINFSEVKTPGSTSLDDCTLQLASPLFPNIKSYPLVNEYVLIVKGPANENPDIGAILKNFYVSIASLWNNQHMNAVPESLNTNTISRSQINPTPL
jgi:hypothetical protein